MPFHHTWGALAPTELLLLHIRNPELHMNRGSFPCPASPFYYTSPHSPPHHRRRPQLGNGHGNHLKLSYHINKGELSLSHSLLGADSTTFSYGCFARFFPKSKKVSTFQSSSGLKAYTVSPNPKNVFFFVLDNHKTQKIDPLGGTTNCNPIPRLQKNLQCRQTQYTH